MAVAPSELEGDRSEVERRRIFAFPTLRLGNNANGKLLLYGEPFRKQEP